MRAHPSELVLARIAAGDAMTDEDVLAAARHVGQCVSCAAAVGYLRAAESALRRARPDERAADPALLARILATLTNGSGAPPARPR
jgi:hypothetical protein